MQGDRLRHDRPIAKPPGSAGRRALRASVLRRMCNVAWEARPAGSVVPIEGREMDVPDPERRRAENAALTESIEELCLHYAPSGAQVEDC